MENMIICLRKKKQQAESEEMEILSSDKGTDPYPVNGQYH